MATCIKIIQGVKKILSEKINSHKQGKVVQEVSGKKTQDTLMGRENVINSTPSSFPSFMASAMLGPYNTSVSPYFYC